MVLVPFNVEGREEKTYYMDGYLKSNLDILKNANKKDWDFVILVSSSGVPRTGKSVIAQQVAYYLDPTFTAEHMCLSAEEFQKKAKDLANTGKKGKAIVYDEAKFGLDSKRAMESVTKALLDFFAECGQINAYLILVCPDFFDLKKEICLNRSICLINTYYTGNFERGYFQFYDRKKKKELFIKGKLYHNYNCTKATFLGRFTNFYTVDEKEYREKKRDGFITGQASKHGMNPTQRKWRMQRDNLIRWLYVNVDMSMKSIGEVAGIAQIKPIIDGAAQVDSDEEEFLEGGILGELKPCPIYFLKETILKGLVK